MATWPKVKLADSVNLLAGFPFKSQQFTDKPEDVPLVKGETYVSFGFAADPSQVRASRSCKQSGRVQRTGCAMARAVRLTRASMGTAHNGFS